MLHEMAPQCCLVIYSTMQNRVQSYYFLSKVKTRQNKKRLKRISKNLKGHCVSVEK